MCMVWIKVNAKIRFKAGVRTSDISYQEILRILVDIAYSLDFARSADIENVADIIDITDVCNLKGQNFILLATNRRGAIFGKT